MRNVRIIIIFYEPKRNEKNLLASEPLSKTTETEENKLLLRLTPELQCSELQRRTPYVWSSVFGLNSLPGGGKFSRLLTLLNGLREAFKTHQCASLERKVNIAATWQRLTA